MEPRAQRYAEALSRMLRVETVSYMGQTDRAVFYEFHTLLRELFPRVFAVCETEEHDGSLLLRWRGRSSEKPILLMHHQDVVEASGEWRYPPFSGEIAEEKVWGRGAVDTKGGLFAMLQAAEELISEGFVPARDIYFESACNEETDGAGAQCIARLLEERGVRFSMVLDEGGVVIHDPIGMADGDFAMIGMGEKGCADLKFIARSGGGHASAPGRDTPLVRLGKFMAEAEKGHIFRTHISPATAEMFRRMAPFVKGPLRAVLANMKTLAGVLSGALASVSPAAEAMVRTTLAFTMAGGSDGTNVLPREAWVVGNMRYSHHQGRERSIEASRRLAAKYDLETVVLDPGVETPLSDFQSAEFAEVERAVRTAFPGVTAVPYVANSAGDSRFFTCICDQCFRFAPLWISDEQLESIHGLNESVDVATLPPAVDFFRTIMRGE